MSNQFIDMCYESASNFDVAEICLGLELIETILLFLLFLIDLLVFYSRFI